MATQASFCNVCGRKAGKKVTICDVSKECQECLSKRGRNSQPIQLNPEKSLAELTVKDLLDIMDKKFGDLETRLTDRFNKMKVELKEEIGKEIDEETKPIKEDIQSMKETQEVLKKTLLEQQQFLEKIRRESSASNVIITGIPKILKINNTPTEDATAKMEHIISVVDNTITENSYKVLKIFDVKQYADGAEKQSVKIKFNEISTKQSFMKKKMALKSLNDNDPLKKVFINNDEPPLTHKENVRLRSKAYELRQQADDRSTIVLQKGVLTKDGTEIDRFDLSNQLF